MRFLVGLSIPLLLGLSSARAEDAPSGDGRQCIESIWGADAALPGAPFTLRYKFHVGWEHGCSQSMESFSESGEIQIEVDAQGEASLYLDLFHFNTFGPSLGNFKQGARDFTHNDTRFRARWKGRGGIREGTIEVKLTRRESTTDPWGASDWRPEKTEKDALDLVCTPASVRLDPPLSSARPDGGPAPQPACAPVILCKFSRPLLSFHQERVRELSAKLFIRGQLPFSPLPGLDADIRDFYNHDWDTLRATTDR